MSLVPIARDGSEADSTRDPRSVAWLVEESDPTLVLTVRQPSGQVQLLAREQGAPHPDDLAHEWPGLPAHSYRPTHADSTREDQLEQLVDRYGLETVLQDLATIARLKADHLRENWQDAKQARKWGKASIALTNAANQVHNLDLP